MIDEEGKEWKRSKREKGKIPFCLGPPRNLHESMKTEQSLIMIRDPPCLLIPHQNKG